MENKELRFLGVDAGQFGAFCFLDTRGSIVEIIDMPYIYGVGVDSKVCWDILSTRKEKYDLRATFELCSYTPSISGKGAFQFGKNIQAVETILICLQLPVMYVRPNEWEKYFGLIKKTKADACHLAYQMQPEHRDVFFHTNSRTKREVLSDGRADAYLIAEYGRRKLNIK